MHGYCPLTLFDTPYLPAAQFLHPGVTDVALLPRFVFPLLHATHVTSDLPQ